MKYTIIITAKNEEQNITDTLNSVVNQTLKPTYCLVVDDGSDDQTAEIIKEFSKSYPFVHYLYNDGEKKYVLGGNVIRVFNVGKDYIDSQNVDYDYVVKMDADIEFESDFFETINNKIKDGKWGIVSGTPYYMEGDRKIHEFSPLWHSHGQFKIYHKKCLEEIGGIDRNLGWDCADNVKAIYFGWKTAAFRDIHYLMFRKVGGKSNLKKGRINHGLGAYQLGYSFAYLLIRAMHDAFKKPYIIGSYFLVFGYFKGLFNKEYVKYLTKLQRKVLRKLFWSNLFKRLGNKEFVVLQQFK